MSWFALAFGIGCIWLSGYICGLTRQKMADEKDRAVDRQTGLEAFYGHAGAKEF